jgi:hypothetical protein
MFAIEAQESWGNTMSCEREVPAIGCVCEMKPKEGLQLAAHREHPNLRDNQPISDVPQPTEAVHKCDD